MKNKLKAPVLFTLLGLPGSGKTYFARQMAEKLGAVHISSEEIRYELFEEPTFSPEEEGVVKHMMLMMTERFLKVGVSVVYDASLNRHADRREMRTIAAKLKVQYMLIWQQIDAQTAYARITNRTGTKPEDKFAVRLNKETFNQLSGSLQLPKNEEYVVISGKHSFQGQFQTVLRKLFETQLVGDMTLSSNLPNPGLVNLVAQTKQRMNNPNRNISIGG